MSQGYYSQTQQQQTPKRGPGAHKAISNAANNGGGLIRITATGHGFANGAKVDITGVVGTTEANGTVCVSILVHANYFDLTSSTFTNAYVRGGMASLQ